MQNILYCPVCSSAHMMYLPDLPGLHFVCLEPKENGGCNRVYEMVIDMKEDHTMMYWKYEEADIDGVDNLGKGN